MWPIPGRSCLVLSLVSRGKAILKQKIPAGSQTQATMSCTWTFIIDPHHKHFPTNRSVEKRMHVNMRQVSKRRAYLKMVATLSELADAISRDFNPVVRLHWNYSEKSAT